MKEALLYKKVDNDNVICNLCNHNCLISPDNTGLCGVRVNKKGTLYTLNYGKLIASHLDPIEKKPLYHFHPGSTAYSIATIGCNFRCEFCQNWEIAQYAQYSDNIPGEDTNPKQIVNNAKKFQADSISYTYTEPTIFFELAYDTAKIAKENGILNTFVTNGFMSKEAIDMISPYLDAANVDLKSIQQEFYTKYCKAKLEPVLENIKYMHQKGIFIEITTLFITGLNDSDEEIRKIAKTIANVNPEIPWHVSRFHPCYKLQNVPSTPINTIKKTRQIGIEAGLKHVYTGNIIDSEGSITYCPQCNTVLISRTGFSIKSNLIKNGLCPQCSYKIHGRF